MKRISRYGRHRKAISEILATIILIAITLVVGAALTGYSFGLFGTLSTTADVQITDVYCTASNGMCTLGVLNTGSASAFLIGCTIYGQTATLGGASPFVIAAGTTTPVSPTCTAPAGMPGRMVEGTVTISNGVTIPFTATWE